jgi:hypothetical protein
MQSPTLQVLVPALALDLEPLTGWLVGEGAEGGLVQGEAAVALLPRGHRRQLGVLEKFARPAHQVARRRRRRLFQPHEEERRKDGRRCARWIMIGAAPIHCSRARVTPAHNYLRKVGETSTLTRCMLKYIMWPLF